MSKSSKLQDYSKYRFNGKEYVIYGVQALMTVGVISYFFYRSILAFVMLLPLIPFLLKRKSNILAKKRQQEINEQFKDAILSVSANQKAGYSVENAFLGAYKDMELLYGEESVICEELRVIAYGLDNNVVLEKLLYSFGVRSNQEDIIQFADVFAIAKRSGGNMTEILVRTAEIISQKVETDKEIQLMISAKKMEQKIMNIVPFLIIFYIELTSKGFFDSLYHNLAGVIIMTGCFILYILAYTMSEKIVEIEV